MCDYSLVARASFHSSRVQILPPHKYESHPLLVWVLSLGPSPLGLDTQEKIPSNLIYSISYDRLVKFKRLHQVEKNFPYERGKLLVAKKDFPLRNTYVHLFMLTANTYGGISALLYFSALGSVWVGLGRVNCDA